MLIVCGRSISKQTISPILKLTNVSRIANSQQNPVFRTMSTTSSNEKLNEQKCEPCKRSTPLLPEEEYDSYKNQLDKKWEIKPFLGSGEKKVLQKSFLFKNFKFALDFTNYVGQLAEKEKHHPEIVLGWGHVEIAWWSHAIGGLHKNDFVCAAKTDQIAAQAEGLKKE